MLPAAITEQKERLCCWVRKLFKCKTAYYCAYFPTIVFYISKMCVFFLLLFMFQRFLESTFFCSKCEIYYYLLLAYYHQPPPKACCWLLAFPSFIFIFGGFPSPSISHLSFSWVSSGTPTHVTLPNLCAFGFYCLFSWPRLFGQLIMGSVKMIFDYISKNPETPRCFFFFFCIWVCVCVTVCVCVSTSSYRPQVWGCGHAALKPTVHLFFLSLFF